MGDAPQTVWITKYALTEGIREAPVVSRGKGLVTVQWKERTKSDCGRLAFFGRDHHDTQAAAFARAEEMRTAKIASHEKSIAKLRKLTFA